MKISAKFGALFMSALLMVYVLLLGQTGLLLLQEEEPIAIAMGALILVFPLFGAWAIVKELTFGLKVEQLSKQILSEGAWPNFDLELRPSGRAVPESASKMFDHFKAIVEAEPNDFHNWFNLGIAYNAAGDRRRARQALLKALELAKLNQS